MGLIYTTAQAAGRRREKCKHKKFSSVRKAADSQAPNVDRCIRDGYQKYRKEVLSDSTWKDTDHHIENLVFSGGGIKSYAFIGALQVSLKLSEVKFYFETLKVMNESICVYQLPYF